MYFFIDPIIESNSNQAAIENMLCLRCPPGSFEIKNLGRQGGYIVEFFFRAATTCCKSFPKKKLFSDDVNFKITNYASYYCLELIRTPYSSRSRVLSQYKEFL